MPGLLLPTSAGDLREGEAWSVWQRAKNDALYALARLALAGVRPLSLRGLTALGRALGHAAYALCPRARDTASANLARVFPGLDEDRRRALVRRCFRTLGELLGETVALLDERTAPPPLPLSEAGRALFSRARSEGRGVLFASAHLGPWERVAGSLVAAGVPLVTIARESYDPRFSRLYAELRDRLGVRVVWRAGPGAALRMARTLREGGVLGVPMDLRSRVPSCEAPFLGHDAPTPVGPARLALLAAAAVFVGTAAPADGGGLQITVTRIESHDLPRGPPGARELTARINAELSRRILALPHAWPWMHERWRPRTGV